MIKKIEIKLKKMNQVYSKEIFIVMYLIIIIFLIKFNLWFSNFVCYISKIPKDLSISYLSFGFRNNFLFILSLAEICVLYFFINKFTYKKEDN